MKQLALVSTIILALGCAHPRAQDARPDLAGMWSDPPPTAEGLFCYGRCTDAGLRYLKALLDDPANDERGYRELWTEAHSHQRLHVLRHLTLVGFEKFSRDLVDDPAFLYCEPWGLARQILAPHQLEITVLGDHIGMRYGEWGAQRTVYLDGRKGPGSPSRLGFSVGRYEGGSLVIESTRISANLSGWGEHSDQLRVVERYTRSGDDGRLLLTATFEDPWSLKKPLEFKKVWSWAPDEEIFPYDSCERPTEFRKREGQP